ncbi:gonadal protein gdl [Teleopsis dalmanni]|uniref:gonadal protein gdl n=1 Tax=Teleopsis dalmanni TaxID=139649 RepID=UPI0018CD2D86|nr:gonadal protein gdl [Teleopsis dalmanni]
MDIETAKIEDSTKENEFSPEFIQRKLYFLLDQLKSMHAKIPEYYQIRISYELLTELANCLVYDTIYQIVLGLVEIQHLTEKHLLQLRETQQKKFKEEMDDWKKVTADKEELEHIVKITSKRHAQILADTDKNIISLLDEKVREQQLTLHNAGVPGFYVTTDPKEITIQIYLLDFILRLSALSFKPNKK